MSLDFTGVQGRGIQSYEDALEFRRAIEQLIPSLQDNGKIYYSSRK